MSCEENVLRTDAAATADDDDDDKGAHDISAPTGGTCVEAQQVPIAAAVAAVAAAAADSKRSSSILSRQEKLHAKFGGVGISPRKSPSRPSRLPPTSVDSRNRRQTNSSNHRERLAITTTSSTTDEAEQEVGAAGRPQSLVAGNPRPGGISMFDSDNNLSSSSNDGLPVAIQAEVVPPATASYSDYNSRDTDDEHFRLAVKEAVQREIHQNCVVAEAVVVVATQHQQDNDGRRDDPIVPFADAAPNRKKYFIPCVILSLVSFMAAIIIGLVLALITMREDSPQNDATRTEPPGASTLLPMPLTSRPTVSPTTHGPSRTLKPTTTFASRQPAPITSPPNRTTTFTTKRPTLAPTHLRPTTATQGPSTSLPSRQPNASASHQAIANGNELRLAIAAFLSNDTTQTAAVLSTYGNPIGSWNVSLVTNFSYAFSVPDNNFVLLFDEDISEWDTSAATDMTSMFSDEYMFSSDLSQWDTSQVTSMSYMFAGAERFNADLSQWDTSKVTNMECMFCYALSFNGDLSSWNTSQVTNMVDMFEEAWNFGSDLSQWDTSHVTNMEWMFNGALRFNSDLSKWDTARVIDMTFMFANVKNFSANLSQWDTRQVANMAGMFSGASSFNSDLSQWNTSQVTRMESMFSGASNFNADLNGWDVSAVTDMSDMFQKASKFSSCLCSWRFKLQGRSVNVAGMFVNTTCPYKRDPDLSHPQNTTFCCACGGT